MLFRRNLHKLSRCVDSRTSRLVGSCSRLLHTSGGLSTGRTWNRELKEEYEEREKARSEYLKVTNSMKYDGIDEAFFHEKTTNALFKWPAARISTLSNGLRVASESIHSDTVTVGVWMDSGSRHETPENNGVAHFCEHLFFKGTPTRTRYDLETEIENIGGSLNAYTSREGTTFFVKVFPNDVEQAVDILADMLQNSTFSHEAVEQERGVILQEYDSVQQQTEEVVFDDLHGQAFQKTPLGMTILGPTDNIRKITREQLMAYRRNFHTADRMIVCATGPVDHGWLSSVVAKKFDKMPEKAETEIPTSPAIFTGSDIRVRYDEQPLAHVAVAFPTCGWNDPDIMPMLVLQTLIGSWNQSVAGGEHHTSPYIANLSAYSMARSMSAFSTLYSDAGLFGVYGIVEEKAMEAFMGETMHELVSHCYSVDKERLFEAKNILKMQVLQSLGGSSAVCEDLGRQMVQHGRRIHPVEALARIDQVDAASVEAVANRFIYDHDFSLAAHGPIWGLPDYNWIRRRTYWLRM